MASRVAEVIRARLNEPSVAEMIDVKKLKDLKPVVQMKTAIINELPNLPDIASKTPLSSKIINSGAKTTLFIYYLIYLSIICWL